MVKIFWSPNVLIVHDLIFCGKIGLVIYLIPNRVSSTALAGLV